MNARKRRLGTLDLIGRVMVSGIFIVAGLEKIRHRESTLRFMRAKNLPMVPAMFGGAVLMELAVAPVLALGLAPRLVAPLLATFLVPTTVVFHDFWHSEGQEKKIQSVSFLKNMAIMGGLISMAARDFEKVQSESELDSKPRFRRPDYLDHTQMDAA